DFAGIGFGVGDEVRNGLGWDRWVHDYSVGRDYDASNRRDVANEIEPLIERRVDRLCRTDHEQRVSVCGRAHDGLGSYVGTSTRSVLNDEWLAEALRQPLPHRTRNGVGIAASGKADQQAHRPRGIGLRPSDTRYGRQRDSARGQMQKTSAGKFHSEPPFTSFDHLVGPGQQRRRDFEAKRLRSRKVYDEI